jgi:hypothetical protein
MDEEVLPFAESPVGLEEPRKVVVRFPLLVGEQWNYPLCIQSGTISRRHPTPNTWGQIPVANIGFNTFSGPLEILLNSIDNLFSDTIMSLKMSPSLHLPTLFVAFIKCIELLIGGTESIAVGLPVNRVEVLLCQAPTLVDCE